MAAEKTLALDENKLAELADAKLGLYLLGKCAELQKIIPTLSQDVFKAEQQGLETQLLQVLTRALGRPAMAAAAKTLGLLLKTGRSDRLFSIINSVNDLIKMRDDHSSRLAAFAYLDEIYRVLGKQTGPLSGDTVVLLGKVTKGNIEQFPLRGEAAQLCATIVDGCAEAAFPLHKEIFKLVRPMLVDKVPANRASAAKCLAAMVVKAKALPSEPEATFSIAVKGLDGSTCEAREELGRLLGVLLPLLPSRQKGQPDDVLVPLALAFTKATTKEARVGVVSAYRHALSHLGMGWLDRNLPVFLVHALNLLSATRLPQSYADTLCARQCVNSLLSYVLNTYQDESGMAKTVKELCKALVKCGKLSEPNTAQHPMIVALQQIGQLLVRLRSVAKPVYDTAKTHIMAALTYPLAAVRLAAAWCLRCLVAALPRRQAGCMLECIDKLYAKKQSPEALHGYSLGLAAMAAIIPASSLGVPHGLSVSMLTMAEELLKSPAKGPLASVQSEAAWTSVAALTAQGSTFFADHMDKAFSLFRDTFTRTAREEELERSNQLSSDEYVSLLVARCHAMGALYSFVRSCKTLLDDQMEKRILGYLSTTSQMAGVTNSSTSAVSDIVRVLKIRMYKTYALFKPTIYQSHLSGLLRLLVADLVHVIGDVSTSLLPELCGADNGVVGDYQDTLDGDLKPQVVGNCVVGAMEYEPMSVVSPVTKLEEESGKAPEPLPSHIGVVDASVTLFGLVFPYCSTKHKKQLLDHLANCVTKAKRSNTSKLHINSLAALLAAMTGLSDGGVSELDQTIVDEGIKVLALGALSSPDPLIRTAAAETVGRAAKAVGAKFADSIVNATVETLKNDRDAISRTGHSLMLGSIMRHAGRLVTRRHMQVTVGILNALANDPTPIVQLWASHALWTTSESTAFNNFVNPTLDTLWGFVFSYAHRSPPVQQCLARLLNTLMTALGPELQMSSTVREACMCVTSYFSTAQDPGTMYAALQCVQTLVVFAPQHVQPANVLPFLTSALESPLPSLRLSAATCLNQMIQRDAAGIVAQGNGIEQVVLKCLNREDCPPIAEVFKKCIIGFINDLSSSDPGRWLVYCNNAMTATATEEEGDKKGEAAEDTQGAKKDDEEEETERGLVGDSGPKKDLNKADLPRSMLKEFAMSCIRELIRVCATSPDRRYHLDLKYLRDHKYEKKDRYLVSKLGTLIRSAFNGATSDSDTLRVGGFRLLLDIIHCFGQAPDPDFEEALLLEQYQAQIGAALRPAFADDVDPGVSAVAGRVCGSWMSSGVTKDEAELRRIQQLIVGPITDTDDTKYAMYNEATGMIVRVALLHAWAEIQLACNGPTQRKYLAPIIDPFLPRLAKLWLDVLRDYAILQLPPRYAAHLGSGEPLCSQWTREAVREHYEASWTTIMAAAALLMPTEYGNVFMQTGPDGSTQVPSDSLYLVFSLCIQALSSPPTPDITTTALHTLANLFSPRINWSEAAVNLDLPQGDEGTDARPKDLVIELMAVLRSALVSHEENTRLLIIGVLRRMLNLGDMLREDKEVRPGNSRVYSVLDLCVCALSTYDAQLVAPPAAPLVQKDAPPFDKHKAPDSRLASASLASLASIPALCCQEGAVQVLPTVLLLVLRCVCSRDPTLAASALQQLHAAAHSPPPSEQQLRSEWDATLMSALATCLTTLEPLIKTDALLTNHKEAIRNLVLAVAVLYGAAPSSVAPLTPQCVALLKSLAMCPQPQLQLAGLQTVRSLLRAVDVSVGAHFVHGIIPEVVVMLHGAAKTPPAAKDTDRIAMLSESMQLIVTLVALAEPGKTLAMLCLLVPLFISLLEDENATKAQPMHPIALQHLIAVAPTYPQDFKTVVASMPPETKQKLERALRENAAAANERAESAARAAQKPKAGVSQHKEPTIQLKMDFSNFG